MKPIRFNPRTRTGCDVIRIQNANLVEVSIHAPARGATRYRAGLHTPELRFNPRTRTGCDTLYSSRGIRKRRFQSTHPHGVRRYRFRGKRKRVSFNPRTRTGCDVTPEKLLPFPWVSIHAPARGATREAISPACLSLFQSTHPHGVRLEPHGGFAPPEGFNPRTRTGCDINQNHTITQAKFQSTHPHGVRRKGCWAQP